MKYERLSKAHFGAQDNPDFNLDAAVKTFNWYMEEDRDVANLILGMSISKQIGHIIEENYDELQGIVEKNFNSRLALLKDSVAKGAISKSMSDGAVDNASAVIDLYEQISKDGEYTTEERSRNASRQTRGQGGRFAPMGRTRLTYQNNPKARKSSPPPEGAGNNISNPRARGQYEQAYRQVASFLDGAGEGAKFAQVHYTDKHGNRYVETRSGSAASDFVLETDFNGSALDRGNINRIEWFDGAPELNLNGAYADPFSQSGMALVNFNRGAVQAGTVRDYESGTTRGMRHVGNAADVINNSGLADNAGPRTKAALAAGKYVGDYGPEAEKVMGPTIRRAAYRYRGVERKPDEKMMAAIKASTVDASDANQAHAALLVPRQKRVETAYGTDVKLVGSPFISYWQGRLPDPELIDLHTNSGAIAPSEGAIINRKGEVVTQAVGYGDDHYLPFNLQKLSRAKGGDYIRTRSVGGPTTEDVYAGLMSGARTVTVVSHSGTYTITYDDSFRGGRRYNDKAARMMQRYGMLTDSLASEKVQTAQIPPDRKLELRRKAEEEYPGNTPGLAQQRKDRYTELVELERQNPHSSEKMRLDWADEYLMVLAESHNDLRPADRSSAKVDSFREREDMTPERLKQQMELKRGARFETDEEFLKELEEDPKFQKFMEHKENEYRVSMKPLRLNGEGYHKALKALQEQFPYYISNVTYIPNDETIPKSSRDPGYVKPRHLRSDKIKTGYWDQEIEGYQGNPSGTGKRRASDENYANVYAHQRLKDGGGQSFSQGGEAADLSEDIGTTAPLAGSGAANLKTETRTYGGATVAHSSGGILRYGNWAESKEIVRGGKLTPWEEVNRAQKVRAALRKQSEITYYENNTKKKASLWSDDGNNVFQAEFPGLTENISEDEWLTKLDTDDAFREQVNEEIKRMSAAKGRRDITGSVARVVLTPGSEIDVYEMPKHPQSVVGLATGLANGNEKAYDFTTSKRDGTYYLPGLTEREYNAAWNSDSDIQGFLANSDNRFNMRMSLKTDKHKMHGMNKDLGKTFLAGLGQADTWRKDIEKYGSPEKVPTKSIVQYGGKEYSITAVSELESQIAQDALAVAKMKQLHKVANGALPDPEDTDKPQIKRITPSGVEQVENLDGYTTTEHRLRGEEKFSTELKDVRGVVHGSKEEKKLEEAAGEIDAMVGLEEPKNEFRNLIRDAQISQVREAEGMSPINRTKHLVFAGDPGTGKTTYAKALAKSYNALGILPTDNVVVVTRADLVGEYQGETAQKTRKVFDEGRGGVIFIDEAYALNSGDRDTYGREAIDEIVALSEERRDDTVIILAGYPGDMNRLFETNPGMKSRFPKTVNFPNYNPEELGDIASRQAAGKDYVLDSASRKEISRVARRIHAEPNMSNARDTRNFMDEVSNAHTARISRVPRDKMTKEILVTVTPEDIRRAEEVYFSTRTGSDTVTKRLKRRRFVRI